ncbi:MAG: glycosyltransferase [Bacteroidota bacterium]
MMKVLTFSYSLGAPTETFIYNELKEIESFVELNLVCCHRHNSELFPLPPLTVVPYEPSRVRAKVLHELRQRNISWAYHLPAFRKRIDALIAERQPELIHCHFGPQAIRFWDNSRLARKLPILISFHGYDASRLLRQKAYVAKMQQLSQLPNVSIICVSHHMRQRLSEAGINTKRSHILYYGTDCEFFVPRSGKTQDQAYTFLQISSFREKKGHQYTLAAYAKFLQQSPDKETQLILAGDGPLREGMMKQAKELKIEKYVHFPGLVKPDQARSLLAAADCFVHHSVTATNGDTEGIPNAIMEAMAMEVPVIATIHAGIPELVEDGVNGYLIKEKDVKAYTKAMHDILSWPRKPENREKVLSAFERKQHAKSLAQIYQQAVQIN